jgi:large-conductance mechanosensitive channel
MYGTREFIIFAFVVIALVSFFLLVQKILNHQNKKTFQKTQTKETKQEDYFDKNFENLDEKTKTYKKKL